MCGGMLLCNMQSCNPFSSRGLRFDHIQPIENDIFWKGESNWRKRIKSHCLDTTCMTLTSANPTQSIFTRPWCLLCQAVSSCLPPTTRLPTNWARMSRASCSDWEVLLLLEWSTGRYHLFFAQKQNLKQLVLLSRLKGCRKAIERFEH